MPYLDAELQKTAQRSSYLKHKATILSRTSVRKKKRRAWMDEVLDTHSCAVCGEGASECLDFHHVDPSSKDDEVAKMLYNLRSMERIIAEMQKCALICSNCHRKHHRGTLGRVFTVEDTMRVPNEMFGLRLKGL